MRGAKRYSEMIKVALKEISVAIIRYNHSGYHIFNESGVAPWYGCATGGGWGIVSTQNKTSQGPEHTSDVGCPHSEYSRRSHQRGERCQHP